MVVLLGCLLSSGAGVDVPRTRSGGAQHEAILSSQISVTARHKQINSVCFSARANRYKPTSAGATLTSSMKRTIGLSSSLREPQDRVRFDKKTARCFQATFALESFESLGEFSYSSGNVSRIET